jgi:hypothetical protein
MNYNIDMKVALFLTSIFSSGFTLNDYLALGEDKRYELNKTTREQYLDHFTK